MDKAADPKGNVFSFAGTISLGVRWIAGIVAGCYATGFICVFTFLNRFGIRESADEFFRIKYIYVGILFLLFPLGVLVPAGLAILLKNKYGGPDSTTTNEPFRLSNTTLTSYLNISLLLVGFLLFATPVEMLDHLVGLTAIAVLTFGGPLLVNHLTQDRRFKEQQRRNLKWLVLFAGVFVLDYFSVEALFGAIALTFAGGIFYSVFLISIFVLFAKAKAKASHTAVPWVHWSIRTIVLSLAALIYMLAVVTFALKIYPFIPASKGGGDFSHALNVRVAFGVSQAESGLSAETYQTLSDGFEYIALEQSPGSYYFAKREDSGGPTSWRELRQLPEILEVRREFVVAVKYRQ